MLTLKKSIFTYLSSVLSTRQLPDQKGLYITEDDCVKHMGEGTPMGQCTREEADARILVHLLHALQTKSIGLINTGDIDCVVMLLANHQQIISANPAADIWIYFHAGKSKRIINLKVLPQILAKRLANLWHRFIHYRAQKAYLLSNLQENVFVGTHLQNAPYVYSFRNLQKSQMLHVVYPGVFVTLLPITSTSANCTCIGKVNQHNVDHLRMDIFTQNMRDVKKRPPTSDALH